MQTKTIHRFIQAIEAYRKDGPYYNQVIPLDTQAYAVYSENDLENHPKGLFYVIGDGKHTYSEICTGKGDTEINKEYLAVSENMLNGTKLTDIVINTTDWIDNTASEVYLKEYKIIDAGITSKMIPNVIFNEEQAISGNYSPVCISHDGYLSIFAIEIPEKQFTIPTILLQ